MKKMFFIVLFIILIILSIAVCIKKPKLHKPFSLNIIEYMIKFNKDGTVEQTKTVTTMDTIEVKE